VQTTQKPSTAGFDSGNGLTDSDIRVSQLSAGDSEHSWAIALFAHNCANTIQAALKSAVAAAGDHHVTIYVLANGCSDATINKVRACASSIPNLWLVEIPLADKANAWNIFVHDLLPEERTGTLETWFFMDSDVTLSPDSMKHLTSRLEDAPDAVAAGGMPGSGRDMDAWRRRMVYNSMLAGNFYALRGSFVQKIRKGQIRMPVGLIGEDFFVSWMVSSITWNDEEPTPGKRCVFDGRAEFMFRSLSLFRLPDFKTYLRRKWRYTLRGIQHHMLITLLLEEGLASMPATVNDLYLRAPLPPRRNWAGLLQTPLNLLATRKIKAIRRRSV
jgi:cellulose synthase/poly-beta-1,6-N-acetylglucosamine synthase-like glycosyltransferase